MSEYVITTDNNSDLPEEYLKDHGVGCMYLSYSMDGKKLYAWKFPSGA